MKQSQKNVSIAAWNAEQHLNQVVKDMPPSGIRKFFDLVSEMKGAISLGVGEPDFVTPWHVREACIYSLESGITHYTSNKGMPELREVISETVRSEQGLTYDPIEQILITTGVSEAVAKSSMNGRIPIGWSASSASIKKVIDTFFTI